MARIIKLQTILYFSKWFLKLTYLLAWCDHSQRVQIGRDQLVSRIRVLEKLKKIQRGKTWLRCLRQYKSSNLNAEPLGVDMQPSREFELKGFQGLNVIESL